MRNICLLFVSCAALHLMMAQLYSQEAKSPTDLNRIIRVKPSETASKIGTGVHWEESWDAAVKQSRSTGKPIFWYVSTIPKTFMDRKTEIDRYMLAGPFSWPRTVERLNRDFVPIRTKPTNEQVETYDLKPYAFVEPGFLILDSNQKVQLRIDHLTTLHPLWFDGLLAGAVGGSPDSDKKAEVDRAVFADAWTALGTGNFGFEFPESTSKETGAEKLLLQGMFAFRRGEHAKAKEIWTQAAQAYPDSPLGWKAAAEAEGFGPFVRGFEVFTPLPEAATRAGIDSVGSAAPQTTYSEKDLWERSVDFLLGMQREDGGVFDSDYDFGGFDSLPNVHCAVTALVGMALLESLPRLDPRRQEAARSAIGRAATFVGDERNINTADKDEILWAQAYRVRFLALLVQKEFGDVAHHRADLNRAVQGLEQIQLKTGGWYHEYANPFVTATALTALHHAESAGAQVDSQKVERGLASLGRDRMENGAYPYSSRSEKQPAGRQSLEAGAGRMPICEMALWVWHKITDDQLAQAAQISLKHHKYLQVAYKYDNHTSTMAYGGFFFWFDMHARAELIAMISDEKIRSALAAQHRKLILDLPEIDGCFVDSHELGRCYGTAMALLSLAQVQ